MYPSGELSQLALRKQIIQARIALHRMQCATAAVELTRPIAQLDRGIAFWHRISPFLRYFAFPAGLLLVRLVRGRGRRAGAKKRGKIAALMAALPLIMRGIKMGMAMRGAYATHARSLQRSPTGGA